MSKLNEAVGKLATFAQYEISDTGEYWRLIAEISRYTNMMSEEFEKALKDEIFELMDDLKNYKLVEVKEIMETVRVEVVYDEFD